MIITLQTRYTDGTVQHETSVDIADERAALGWALQNWHPARGQRIVDAPTFGVPVTPRFYLNDALFVSAGGGFENVRDVVARLQAPERKAA